MELRNQFKPRTDDLLLFEIDGFVVVASDSGANLCGRIAQLSEAIGVEGLFGAGGTLGAVQALVATAQAGVAESAVASAVAGQLVEHVADSSGLLIDVHLPRIAEVLARKPGSCEDGRQRAHFERRSGMIGGDLVGGIGPLRIAGDGDCGNGEGYNPAIFCTIHDERLSRIF